MRAHRALKNLAYIFLTITSTLAYADDSATLTAWQKNALNEYISKANGGDPASQGMLGIMYLRGLNVPPNPAEGVRWLKIAVANGNTDAAALLAQAYSQGAGTKKDFYEAARLYRLAAENCNLAAQNALGEAYAKGLGVKKNNRESYFWFLLVNGSSNIDNNQTMNEVRNTLTLSDISIIKNHALEWLKLHPRQINRIID